MLHGCYHNMSCDVGGIKHICVIPLARTLGSLCLVFSALHPTCFFPLLTVLCSPMPEGRWPRGVTPHPRSGAAAERSYPTPPCLRPGAAAGGATPRQGAVAAWAQEGLEELSHVEGQEGRQWGDTHLVQGEEQRLRFAGAAMKRYPMPKVRETQVRR